MSAHALSLSALLALTTALPALAEDVTLRYRAGQVDAEAFSHWQTTFEGVARQGGGIHPIFDATDVLGEIAGGFAVLRRDWVDAQPEAARAFVDASARALDWSREHPEETREIFARALEERGENFEVAQHFAGFGVLEGGLPVERDIQFWIDMLEREGQLAPGQLAARDILLVTADAPAATNRWGVPT